VETIWQKRNLSMSVQMESLWRRPGSIEQGYGNSQYSIIWVLTHDSILLRIRREETFFLRRFNFWSTFTLVTKKKEWFRAEIVIKSALLWNGQDNPNLSIVMYSSIKQWIPNYFNFFIIEKNLFKINKKINEMKFRNIKNMYKLIFIITHLEIIQLMTYSKLILSYFFIFELEYWLNKN